MNRENEPDTTTWMMLIMSLCVLFMSIVVAVKK